MLLDSAEMTLAKNARNNPRGRQRVLKEAVRAYAFSIRLNIWAHTRHDERTEQIGTIVTFRTHLFINKVALFRVHRMYASRRDTRNAIVKLCRRSSTLSSAFWRIADRHAVSFMRPDQARNIHPIGHFFSHVYIILLLYLPLSISRDI